jgi:hypothetical protein
MTYKAGGLGEHFTFQPSREVPIFNWFHYKEAYSPELVKSIFAELPPSGWVLDPFCGVGTTPLACKSMGIGCRGVDASPLAVFVSNAKCADYSKEDVQAALEFIGGPLGDAEPLLRWEFELFPPERAFPKRNLHQIIRIREKIAELPDSNSSRLLLLALLSILPECSFTVKDGGFLRIRKSSLPPAWDMFRRKVKRMAADLENPINGPLQEISLGDARKLEFENESFSAVMTSPPYLNNVDYTKIYGLELSLLMLDPNAAQDARTNSIRSFISSRPGTDEMPEEAVEQCAKVPIAAGYFSDMKKAIIESYRVLAPSGYSVMVVGDAVIGGIKIDVCDILCEIGRNIGFSECGIIGSIERTADIQPRKEKFLESAIMMRK